MTLDAHKKKQVYDTECSNHHSFHHHKVLGLNRTETKQRATYIQIYQEMS